MAVANTVSVSDLRRAIEGRDGRAMSELYRDDAVVRIIDRDHPPSTPREIRGREAIAAFFDDICGRDMTHRFESGLAEGDRVAYTESCAYPDGTKVFCSSMMELKNGRVARETIVQAWDG
ncbi:MAG TPA: nuclear transport factor 2 family protein [Hyphomicrobiales bacterium]|nr:nuclear transport factor 2 family protein [Hyphomicrobiales bacterium]